MDKYAYLAGFVDGEGCIEVVKYYRKDKYVYTLSVRANNTKEAPIQMLHEIFGGHRLKRLDKRKKGYKVLYGWCVKSQEALIALRTLLPYLVVKKEEAVVGIDFQENQKSLRLKTTDFNTEQTWREEHYQVLRRLK